MPENEKSNYVNQKDRVKEITDNLEKGIKELLEGDKFKTYLNTMSKFHNYSLNNTMLIAMQKPDATLVAGFNSWKNKFERNVNKGEKGIQIFAPAPYTIKKEQIKLDEDTQLPVLDKDGKPVTEEVEVKIPSFKVVSVFDVSQTNGKELPTLGVDELSGNVKDYEKFFEALKTVSPVPIRFENIKNGAKGYFDKAENVIAINNGMSETQTIKTAVHEIAHSILHNLDLKKSDLDKPKDRNTEEVEAESVAYTVCQHFGIDTSDYSFAYVASWGTGKDIPELRESLETIRATASDIINKVSDILLEREKEQEQVQTADLTEKKENSNIIGNTAYASIEDKQYFRLNSKTAEKVAEKLTEQNIPFSGRINGDKTTLTISAANVDSYKAIIAEVTEKKTKTEPTKEVSAESKEKAKLNIIGNTAYKDIPDKTYIKISTEKAIAIAQILEAKGIKFSGRVNDDKTTLTISKNDMSAYKEALMTINASKVAEKLPEPKVAVDYHPHFHNEFILKEIASGATITTGTKEQLIEFCKAELAASVHIPQLIELIDKAQTERPEITKEPDKNKVYDGKLPDDSITVKEMNDFGYDYAEMLPMREEKALELFDSDMATVYLLYDDNTECQANSRDDIKNHAGLYGVEIEDWSKCLAVMNRFEKLESEEPGKEAMLMNGKEDTIAIYQLKSTPENHLISFASLDFLEKQGKIPDRDNYTLIYCYKEDLSNVTDMSAFLESVFEKFNMDHPKDFMGHSLSTSDVVAVKKDGEISAHYVDSVGFTQLTQFGDIGRENPLKAIEDTVEQNDNAFDAVINNKPTADELEERAKRGEVINLTDLYDAVKRENTQEKKTEPKAEKKLDEKRSIRDYLRKAKEQKQPEHKSVQKQKGIEI